MPNEAIIQALQEQPPGEEDRYPYGKPRFPNLDPRAYFDKQSVKDYGEEPLLSKLGEIAPWALMGLGRVPTARPQPMQPQTIRREVKQAGDDSVGQHVYEAVLGRTRKPGQAVGEPGSGWWMVGGQPIPKPTNVLPHLVAGGVGYGIYKGLGGPSWDEIKSVWNSFRPGTPEYEAQQQHVAKVREQSRQEQQARDASKEELEAFYGPEARQYGLPYGMEGMRRLGQLPRRERTLPSVNAIPFPPDPNKP